MLSKGSDEYKTITESVGLPDISLPRRFRDYVNDEPVRVAITRIRYIAHTVQDQKKAFELASSAANSIDNPRQTFFRSPPYNCGRAFFIVSDRMLRAGSFAILGGVARVIHLYGGRCFQRFEHYHYVIVTDYDVRRDHVMCICNANITLVGTSTFHCKRYIDSQLYIGERPYSYTMPGYSGDVLDWVSPQCPNTILPSREWRQTNYVWEGGEMVSPRQRGPNEKLAFYKLESGQLPTRFPFSDYAIYYVESNVLSESLTGSVKDNTNIIYRGQPVLWVTRGDRTNKTTEEMIEDLVRKDGSFKSVLAYACSKA